MSVSGVLEPWLTIGADNIWKTIRALYSQVKELHSLETIKQAVDKLRLLTVKFSSRDSTEFKFQQEAPKLKKSCSIF